MVARPLRDRVEHDLGPLLEKARASAAQPLVRDRGGVVVNALDTAMPTPERLQHGAFVEADTYRNRETRNVVRALDVRDRLYAAGVIDDDQSKVWRTFNAKFHAGSLDPLRAQNLLRSGGGRGTNDPMEDAREWVCTALIHVGAGSRSLGPVGEALWWVCGVELSLREFSRRYRWGNRGLIDPRAACGLLVAGLTVLARGR